MTKKAKTKKAKTKKAKTKKTHKRTPRTIRVWIPVEVSVTDGEASAFVPENDKVHEKPTERIRKDVENDMLQLVWGPGWDAAHMIWVEATLPVPQVRKTITVKGAPTA